MKSDYQSPSLNGFMKACAVTALIPLAAPVARAQQPDPTAGVPLSKDSTLEKVLNPGPFEIRPHAAVSAFYDNNIFLRSSDRDGDFVWALSPGVLIGTGSYKESDGNFALVDYTPTIYFFTEDSSNNGVNHDLNASAQWKKSKLTLGLSQGYYAAFGGLLDATNRLDRELAGSDLNQQTIPTTLRVMYDFSDKTSVEVNGRQIIRLFKSEFNDYNEWINANWVNYKYTEKLAFGAGATFGWRDIRNNPNQMYEQGLLRAVYNVAEKVTAIGRIGLQWDQYDNDFERGPSFIFGGTLNFRPRESTLVALDAYRQEQNSIYAGGQSYVITGFRAAVRQRFLEKFTANVSGGYDFTDYRATSDGTQASREDDFFFFGGGVDYSITTRWDAGVFANYRKNDSTDGGFSYEDFQAGLRSSFRF
jgi:hypothetical protein